jgi:hypothetical protein
MASINVEAAPCSADPVDLRIGRSRRNWKFRSDMHSMSVGYHCQKLFACAPVDLRSAIEGRAALGPGTIGRHEGALRDHSFPIASQRFEDADAPIVISSCGTSV